MMNILFLLNLILNAVLIYDGNNIVANKYSKKAGQIFSTFKEWIDNTIKAIEGVAKYESLNSFQQKMLEADVKKASEIRRMFISAINDMIKENSTAFDVNTAEFEEIVDEDIKSSRDVDFRNILDKIDYANYKNAKNRLMLENQYKHREKDFILISNEADDKADKVTGRTPSVKIVCLKADGIDGTINPYIIYEIRDLHDTEKLNEIINRVVKIEQEGYVDSERVTKDLFSTIRRYGQNVNFVKYKGKGNEYYYFGKTGWRVSNTYTPITPKARYNGAGFTQTYKEFSRGQLKSSKTVDTDGNKLSQGQIEYYKDSEVRDNEGKLKVVYHETDKDFTVFKNIKTYPGYWFTESKEYAQEHGENVNKYYLNIKNLFDIDNVDLDVDNVPIIISIHPDGKGKINKVEIPSNFITGYYGRDGFVNFIKNTIDSDKVLYVNKEKATNLSDKSTTLWVELLEKVYDFDTIIRKLNNSVNTENGLTKYSINVNS